VRMRSQRGDDSLRTAVGGSCRKKTRTPLAVAARGARCFCATHRATASAIPSLHPGLPRRRPSLPSAISSVLLHAWRKIPRLPLGRASGAACTSFVARSLRSPRLYGRPAAPAIPPCPHSGVVRPNRAWIGPARFGEKVNRIR
jgi:hypothetical protein